MIVLESDFISSSINFGANLFVLIVIYNQYFFLTNNQYYYLVTNCSYEDFKCENKNINIDNRLNILFFGSLIMNWIWSVSCIEWIE